MSEISLSTTDGVKLTPEEMTPGSLKKIIASNTLSVLTPGFVSFRESLANSLCSPCSDVRPSAEATGIFFAGKSVPNQTFCPLWQFCHSSPSLFSVQGLTPDFNGNSAGASASEISPGDFQLFAASIYSGPRTPDVMSTPKLTTVTEVPETLQEATAGKAKANATAGKAKAKPKLRRKSKNRLHAQAFRDRQNRKIAFGKDSAELLREAQERGILSPDLDTKIRAHLENSPF